MHLSIPVACLLVVGLFSGCSSPRTTPSATTRKNAPEFALPRRHGDLIHLGDYRGRVLILNFWATWCGPCRIEIPWFNELVGKYNGSGLAVLGVSLDENGWQAVDPFVRELKVVYPIVLGNNRIARQYGLGPPPTTFILDREGRIAATFAGLADRRVVENEVERLLQQK